VILDSKVTARLPRPLTGAVHRLLQIDALEELYESARGPRFSRNVLESLQVSLDIASADHSRIPTSGPVIAVANHPYGMLDGIALAELFSRARPDLRILTNRILGRIPELAPLCFFVDPFDNPASRAANGRALRQAIDHLRSGGLMLVFPAGEVSHFDIRTRTVRDPEWNPTVVRLIRKTRAKALPVCITGSNGLPFQMLGMIHPRLRTAALPAELLNKRGRAVEIRIGSPVEPTRIDAIEDDRQALSYLRFRTELLARRAATQAPAAGPGVPTAPPCRPDLLARELASLPASSLLTESREFAVHIAPAAQIPNILAEIGRLREITFRAAGEGTGKATDLDSFDASYLHLFLWNREKIEIAGAYRLGDVPALLSSGGSRALYTNSLFRFRPGFFRTLGSALELGRSFVRPEYQRQFAPLLLLWKGIGEFVARNPAYSMLIGAVSVSNSYSPASRELIALYFERQNLPTEWRGAVRARRPLRSRLVQKWELDTVADLLPTVEDLSSPIADIEHDSKGVPVLVRQYAKLGGRLLAFSVDPRFQNCLDGFVLVDLTRTAPESLTRYLGREGAERFLAWHAAKSRRAA
jgi:putative hemolysin